MSVCFIYSQYLHVTHCLEKQAVSIKPAIIPMKGMLHVCVCVCNFKIVDFCSLIAWLQPGCIWCGIYRGAKRGAWLLVETFQNDFFPASKKLVKTVGNFVFCVCVCVSSIPHFLGSCVFTHSHSRNLPHLGYILGSRGLRSTISVRFGPLIGQSAKSRMLYESIIYE